MLLRRLFLMFMLTAPAVFTLSACQKSGAPETAAVSAHTVYLVRHAEKQKGDDPALTDAGKVRADLLRDKLKDKGVAYIHASNYRRTLETAGPLAEELGMDVLLYDPRDLQDFADYLKSMPGVHLVVGHSNTTPELAALLAGESFEPMPETEYDRFITVMLGAGDEAASSVVERFGAGE